VDKKLEKEANRYIQQWPEEKIALENGRWGPFIRFGKQMMKIPKAETGEKYTAEQLGSLSLDQVKHMILAEDPQAFDKKTAKRKTAKTAAKKPAAKRAVKKAAARKK
jgi:DNA topoisomerase-1